MFETEDVSAFNVYKLNRPFAILHTRLVLYNADAFFSGVSVMSPVKPIISFLWLKSRIGLYSMARLSYNHGLQPC